MEPLKQIGVEVRGVEFLVEATETGENLFGQFRLEAGIEVTAEKDAAGGGAELTYGAFAVELEGAATLGKGLSIVGRERILMGEV